MMDFVVGLLRIASGKDAIWIIIDRLTKTVHFIPIKISYSLDMLARLYVNEIICRHGMLVFIISDRDPRLTSRFWTKLQGALGTQLRFSTAFHPQTDGQSERTIQTLEDMLRTYVIEFIGSWDDHLSLIKFAYNNNYHSIIDMALYEALYGRRYRTLVC